MAENFQPEFEKTGWKVNGLTFPDNIEGPYWPRFGDVFCAFTLTKQESIERVILGQDPYPSNTQEPVATGVAFGVKNSTAGKPPKSLEPLLNAIYPPGTTADRSLVAWSKKHKILMLNCALTVPQGLGNKCSGKHLLHWKEFRLKLVSELMKQKPSIKWLAVGKAARETIERALIDNHRSLNDSNYDWCYHPNARIKADDRRSFRYFCNNELSNFIAH